MNILNRSLKIMLFIISISLGLTVIQTIIAKATSEGQEIEEMLLSGNIEGIRNKGPVALTQLAQIYETSDVNKRTVIARTFYMIGQKSPEATNALMKDIHTTDTRLRLEVQWALGRVSNNKKVLMALLDNMQNDPNPLFRDKSACALASDQIHLKDEQKVLLFEGLIQALDDPKPQVRDIAIKALHIQTGQTKGFKPNASQADRSQAIEVWIAWLEEYKANL